MCDLGYGLFEEGIQKGMREGKREGKREGLRIGQQQYQTLLKLLKQDHRESDIIRMADNPKLQNELFVEYGIR